MFKNRKITVTVDKKNGEQTTSTEEEHVVFEKKTGIILPKLERIGIKVFAGVCIYVLLDTYRQVKVAEAKQPYDQD